MAEDWAENSKSLGNFFLFADVRPKTNDLPFEYRLNIIRTIPYVRKICVFGHSYLETKEMLDKLSLYTSNKRLSSLGNGEWAKQYLANIFLCHSEYKPQSEYKEPLICFPDLKIRNIPLNAK